MLQAKEERKEDRHSQWCHLVLSHHHTGAYDSPCLPANGFYLQVRLNRTAICKLVMSNNDPYDRLEPRLDMREYLRYGPKVIDFRQEFSNEVQ